MVVYYRKIPKIVQRPLLRALYLEVVIFGGAYLRREICVSKSIEFCLTVGSKFTVFASFYFVFEGKFSSTSPRRGGGGLFYKGFFALPVWRGLYLEGFISGILRYID